MLKFLDNLSLTTAYRKGQAINITIWTIAVPVQCLALHRKVILVIRSDDHVCNLHKLTGSPTDVTEVETARHHHVLTQTPHFRNITFFLTSFRQILSLHSASRTIFHHCHCYHYCPDFLIFLGWWVSSLFVFFYTW